MGRKSKITGALDAIKAFFESEDHKVFSENDLKQIYYHNNRAWNLPDTMSFGRFMDRVGHQIGILKIQIEALEMHSYTSEKLDRYLIGDPSVYEIALSLRGNSYLSHYSSMFLHGLTQQIPKNIYVSFEQSENLRKPVLVKSLSQQLIMHSPSHNENPARYTDMVNTRSFY